MTRKSDKTGLPERALALREKGLATNQIVERLGLRDINHAHRLISTARKRKPKQSQYCAETEVT